jgi:hypothetical protein
VNAIGRFRWVILAVLAVGLVAGAWLSSRSASDGDGTVEVRGELGPTPGPNADGYVAEKRSYLERLSGEKPTSPGAALVSLAERVSGARAAELALGGTVDRVFVVLPGGEPEDLATPLGLEEAVAARVSALQQARRAEVAALRERAKNASPDQRQALERDALDSQAKLDALRADCPCVYAFVVRGLTLARLSEVQADPDVRLVDVPEPLVGDVRGWLLTPLLPG